MQQQVESYSAGGESSHLFEKGVCEATVDDMPLPDAPMRSPTGVLQAILSAQSPATRQTLARQFTLDPEYSATRSALVEAARHKSRAYKIVKRGLDIGVSGLLLLILLPLFVVIGLAIVWESGHPILFHQPRIGCQGKSFRFYKFRSMVQNADALKKQLAERNEATGPHFKMREDPRVTRVGRILRRTSLDELPQLINVLGGDASLIGPRPLVPVEAMACDGRQQLRHTVQPGLLCLREISGRSALSFNEWMELDLLYVASQSLLTDIRILFKAFPAILCGTGAY